MFVTKLVTTLLLWSKLGWSAVPPGQATVKCHHEDSAELIRKVVEFTDSAKQRETVPEYAKSHDSTTEAMQARFAATGVLKCGNSQSTANLVGKNNIVVTAGHSFVDPETCAVKAKPTSCSFTVEGKRPVMVASLAAIGLTCYTRGERHMDWAVLKLKEPIEGITPYVLKPTDDVPQPQAVVAVGAQSVDFIRKDPKTGKLTMVKHVQDCNVKRVYVRSLPYQVHSDCAGSYGKSGGAFLVPGSNPPTIVAITVGSPMSTAEGKREKLTGKPTRKPYHEEDWADGGVTISGVLYNEIQQANK